MRLQSLKVKLEKQLVLDAYDKVFKEYEESGYIERVPLNETCKEPGKSHYLPHRPVIREDKETTKIRPVFDASCKVNGPSLNDCLYSGPNLLSKIFDALLQFWLNRIGILVDIKKAFYQVAIADEHKYFLRFLLLDSSSGYDSIVVFRFLRAIMGVTSSPFLLNAILRHHLGKYLGSDLKELVQKVFEDLYVDDLVSGSESVEQEKFLFEKSKKVMSDAGF